MVVGSTDTGGWLDPTETVSVPAYRGGSEASWNLLFRWRLSLCHILVRSARRTLEARRSAGRGLPGRRIRRFVCSYGGNDRSRDFMGFMVGR
jgi:hypothetical protein